MITIFKDYNFELKEEKVDKSIEQRMNQYLGIVYEIAKELNEKTDRRLTLYHEQLTPSSFDVRIAVKLPKSAEDPTPLNMVLFSIDPYDNLLIFGNRTKVISDKNDLKLKIARVFELKAVKSFIEESNLHSKLYEEAVKKNEEKIGEVTDENV